MGDERDVVNTPTTRSRYGQRASSHGDVRRRAAAGASRARSTDLVQARAGDRQGVVDERWKVVATIAAGPSVDRSLESGQRDSGDEPGSGITDRIDEESSTEGFGDRVLP